MRRSAAASPLPAVLPVPAVLTVLALAAACGGTATSTANHPANHASAHAVPSIATGEPPSIVTGIEPAGGIFGPASIWKTSIVDAPVAADSAALVAHLAAEVADRYGGVAAFNAHQYNPALTVVGPDQPTSQIGFFDCQGKGAEPAGLREQLSDVPIPATASIAKGTDAEVTIWQPSTDRLWELWRASRTATGWQACYGGRIDHVSTSPGYFADQYGATATSLPGVGGMVGIADVRSGSIDHAIDLEIVDPRAGTFSYPAQRDDGDSTDPTSIPEGTRLRLDPSVDVDALHLSPIATMVAKAAQTYGFIVSDRSGAVSVEAEDPQSAEALTGVDPWVALEDGVPDYAILKGFPWADLQALPQNWGKPAG
jgi:hypothetical protein